MAKVPPKPSKQKTTPDDMAKFIPVDVPPFPEPDDELPVEAIGEDADEARQRRSKPDAPEMEYFGVSQQSAGGPSIEDYLKAIIEGQVEQKRMLESILDKLDNITSYP